MKKTITIITIITIMGFDNEKTKINYDTINNINFIDAWNKREDSYDRKWRYNNNK